MRIRPLSRNRAAVALAAATLITSTLASHLPAQEREVVAAPQAAVELWERMGEARQRTEQPVPADGLLFEFQGMRFVLRSGTIQLPLTRDGEVPTSLVFEGDGEFSIEIPDAFEFEQLRRFTRNEEIDQNFRHRIKRLYLRTSAPEITRPLQELAESSDSVAPSAGEPLPRWADDRRERWLLHEHQDADARVVAALSTFGERYLRADLELEEVGWKTISFDARRLEEITLEHPTQLSRYYAMPVNETWLSLDRVEERGADGWGTSSSWGFARTEHLDAAVDLTELGRWTRSGSFGRALWFRGKFRSRVTFASQRDGLGAVIIRLDPRAEEVRAHAIGEEGQRGAPLGVLRARRGEEANHLRNASGPWQFVIALDEVVREGDRQTIEIEYEHDVLSYAPGGWWYPEVEVVEPPGFTAEIELTTRGDHEAIALGERLVPKELPADHDKPAAHRVWRWRTHGPARMLGWTIAQYAARHRFEWDGLPAVTLFGTTGGYMSSRRIAKLERFAQPALQCLVDRYGMTPQEELVLALVPSASSQAFSGFVQLSENVAKRGGFGEKIGGKREFEFGHEISHQWWGHHVASATPRDAWWIESLADWSAISCLQRLPKDAWGPWAIDGPGMRRDAIASFRAELFGDLRRAMSSFSRTYSTFDAIYEEDRLTPLDQGFRGMMTQSATGNLIAQRRGALVLHMIDELLRVEELERAGVATDPDSALQVGGDDTPFARLLRERLGADPLLSTEGMEARLGEVSELDWPAIFDQWVRRAELPFWKVDWAVDGDRAQLRVRQEHLGDFEEPPQPIFVPVRATLADGGVLYRIVRVDQRNQTLEIEAPSPIAEFTFDPELAVPVEWKRQSLLGDAATRRPAASP